MQGFTDLAMSTASVILDERSHRVVRAALEFTSSSTGLEQSSAFLISEVTSACTIPGLLELESDVYNIDPLY